MKYVTIVEGDLLDADETYILHQCNCVTSGSKGLATKIFNKYPYANTYVSRTTNSVPGTYDILGNGASKRYVVNLYSQYYPMQAKYNNDTKELRLKWFIDGLNLLVAENEIDSMGSIAMPFNIGCGLAGGDWTDYYAAIKKFAKDNKIKVTLYKII